MEFWTQFSTASMKAYTQFHAMEMESAYLLCLYSLKHLLSCQSVVMKPSDYILKFACLTEIPPAESMERFTEMLVDWRYTLRNETQRELLNECLTLLRSQC